MLYISEACAEHKYFGAIKLNKILYYSDFIAYERLDLPITGAAYRKLKHGPAPEAMVPIREEMVKSGLAKVEARLHPRNHEEHRLIPLRKADASMFTLAELEIVNEVIAKLKDLSATDTSDLSHDIRWKTVELNTLMPYDMAWMSDEPITEYDIKRTEELAKKYGWKQA